MTLRWARFLGMHVCSFCVNRQQTVVRLAIFFFAKSGFCGVLDVELSSWHVLVVIDARWKGLRSSRATLAQCPALVECLKLIISTFDYAAGQIAFDTRFEKRNCGVSPVPTYNHAARNLLSNSRVLLSVTLQTLFNSISQLSINHRSRAKMTSMRFRSRPGLHTA